MKKKIMILSLAVILGVSLSLVGCGSSSEPAATPAPAPAPAESSSDLWLQPHIGALEPLMMKDPFLELLGQVDGPVPYLYEETVKLSGHSCGAITGAWVITEKALEALYGDETPVRGDIKIYMPGPPDQYYIGVFGEVFTYLTGATPDTGFPGADFGQEYNRRHLLIYPEEQTKLPFPAIEYIWERTDTGKQIGIKYNLSMVQPLATDETKAILPKMLEGTATAEETALWVKWWNDRAIYVLDNKDMEGMFPVRVIEEGN